MTAATADAPSTSRLRIAELGHPVLVALTVVGCVAALAARFVVPSALWLDEALSVNISKLPLDRIIPALRHDGHPPLYYFLLHGWMLLVGESDGAVRALSGLISLATLPFAYLAGRRVAGPRAGWTALIALSLSPFFLRFGSETRMYSLVILLVFIGYLLVWDLLERVSPWRLAALAAVTCALLWTHYWSLWLLIALGALVKLRVLIRWRATRQLDRPSVAILLALAVGVIGFLPWLPNMLYQAAHTGTPWARPFRPATLIVNSLVDFNGGPYSEPQLLMLISVVLLTIGLFGRGVDDWHVELDFHTRPEARPLAAILVTTMLIAIAAALASHSAFAGRYASVYFPFYVLLVALGIDHIRGVTARSLVLGVFLALSLVGLAVTFRLERTQAVEVTRVMKDQPTQDALVITCPDQLGPATRRALPKQIEVRVYPTMGRPERVDWVDYAKRNAAANPAQFAERVLTLAHNRPLYVVMNDGYRTFEHQCGDLVNLLASRRPARQLVTATGDGTYYEVMSLYAFDQP